jgi:hypothetical protein
VLTTIEMTTIEKGKIDQPCWIVCGDGLRMRCIWWRGEMPRKKRGQQKVLLYSFVVAGNPLKWWVLKLTNIYGFTLSHSRQICMQKNLRCKA